MPQSAGQGQSASGKHAPFDNGSEPLIWETPKLGVAGSGLTMESYPTATELGPGSPEVGTVDWTGMPWPFS